MRISTHYLVTSRFVYIHQDSYIYIKIRIYTSRFVYIYIKIRIYRARFVYIQQDSYIYSKIRNKSGPLPTGTLLVSWDVVSMFPNIDNKLGLTAVRKALNVRENKFPSTTCILEAVKICLKSNHSVFKENFFLQIHGTAMAPMDLFF